MRAPLPERRPRPLRTMGDMGMSMEGMNMAGMDMERMEESFSQEPNPTRLTSQ